MYQVLEKSVFIFGQLAEAQLLSLCRYLSINIPRSSVENADSFCGWRIRVKVETRGWLFFYVLYLLSCTVLCFIAVFKSVLPLLLCSPSLPFELWKHGNVCGWRRDMAGELRIKMGYTWHELSDNLYFHTRSSSHTHTHIHRNCFTFLLNFQQVNKYGLYV